MKIAVIDAVGHRGGATRFILNLLPALIKNNKNLEIQYFGSSSFLSQDNNSAILSDAGIQLTELKSTKVQNLLSGKKPYVLKFISTLQDKYLINLNFLPYVISGNIKSEIETKIKGFDLALFPWPYFLPVPSLACPIVAVFHDFNFHYYFGGQFTFSEKDRHLLHHQFGEWLLEAFPVVTSDFMKSELIKFYPHTRNSPSIIRMATFSTSQPTHESISKVYNKFNIDFDYVIYPHHMVAHKNLLCLISAISILNKPISKCKLILTGSGTQFIKGHAMPWGVELSDAHDIDVIGLGYVNNYEMDALIAGAKAVINTSVYEAGNGPGLDAWFIGTPTAMSDIPQFYEHAQYLNIKSHFFDPLSASQIAQVILKILNDGVSSVDYVNHSANSIRGYSWREVATSYISLFKSIVVS